ncbi:MAG TPA: adenylate/guanylate cyclase domain-containing protein [Vicinamibacteria bacterium]|nr:adenylate/guanylate cyclase domain-containing protein [Vicinamibacteria bacterium]
MSGPAPDDLARGARLAHLRHELRSPVNAIIGYSEMLLEDAPDGPDSPAPDLRKIREAGQALLQKINEALAPQNFGAGRALETEGARIRHDLRTPVNAILGYSEMLLEDAETGGGEPTLVDDLRRIHAAGEKLLVLLDDIVSISAGATETKPRGGEVDSMIAEALSALKPRGDTEPVTAAGGLILVVDDNPVNRDMLSRRLQREGHFAVAVENGRQALDMVREHPFDLVLLDILMPEMNGYQVLEAMKGDDDLRHIPVIMISALDEVESVVRCLEIGAEDYLPKPFNPVILRARIGASLEKKRLRDRQVVHLRQIEEEKRRADELLHVILPHEIVMELKEKNEVTPRRHEDVAVLFCDIVGFTPYSASRQPEEIVHALQLLFEAYEDLAERHRMYKIKTIGDSFMSTANLITPVDNPVATAVSCGLDMVKAAKTLPAGWDVRVGIHAGPVVAGVVGRKTYLYDLWGDTVNTAARVESHGAKGAVNVSASAWERVRERAEGVSLGMITVKGKGTMEIHRVESIR